MPEIPDFAALDQRVLDDIRALVAGARTGSTGDFWRTLSEKHAAILRETGFRNFKRTLNFEYSQWGVSSFRDRKIRHLAAGLLRRGLVPYGGFLARADMVDAEGIRWPDGIHPRTAEAIASSGAGLRSGLRAYAFYCGLLWQLARHEDALGCLDRVEEPLLGNPMPIRVGGRLISQDIALSALSLNRIARHVPRTRLRRVLEIGAGYGRLAWLFRSMFPETEYVILDIPPALAVSRNYLESVFGPEQVSADFEAGYRGGHGRHGGASLPGIPGIHLVPADRADTLPDRAFDLVINISSFDEMTPDEVAGYFRLLERVGNGWLYLQGYAANPFPGRRLSVPEFPYGETWREVYGGRDLVIPKFVEQVRVRRDVV